MPKGIEERQGDISEEGAKRSVLKEWAKTIAYAVVLAIIIRTFLFATFYVPSGSMIPTLHPGDRLIALKFIYGFPIPFTGRRVLAMTEPHRGDVIIFDSHGIEGLDKGKDYIKRLVGLGEEHLQIVPEKGAESFTGYHWRTGGHVHIDGETLEAPASVADRLYFPDGEYGSHEVTIPEGHYFMLGDNAGNSRDSRFWGFVPKGNVIGRAVFIYWPPKRIGRIE